MMLTGAIILIFSIILFVVSRIAIMRIDARDTRASSGYTFTLEARDCNDRQEIFRKVGEVTVRFDSMAYPELHAGHLKLMIERTFPEAIVRLEDDDHG